MAARSRIKTKKQKGSDDSDSIGNSYFCAECKIYVEFDECLPSQIMNYSIIDHW